MADNKVSRTPGAAPRDGSLSRITVTMLFMLWGFCVAMNGVLVPFFKREFSFGYTEAALVQFVFYGVLCASIFLVAFKIDRVPPKRMLILGLVLIAVGSAGVVLATSAGRFLFILAALGVLAAGIATVQPPANRWSGATALTNIGSFVQVKVEAFNAIASMAAPLLAGSVILAGEHAVTGAAFLAHAFGPLQRTYALVGVVALILILAVMVQVIPVGDGSPESAPVSAPEVSRFPWVTWCMLALHFGAEVSIATFLISYLTSPRIGLTSTATAAAYLGVYWGGIMIGRFVSAAVMRSRIPFARILTDNSIGAVALIALSMLLPGQLAMWCLLLSGICISTILPAIFAFIPRSKVARSGGQTTLLFTSIAGAAVLSLLQGVAADCVGIVWSYVVPLTCYVLVFVYALGMLRKNATVVSGGS